ncbi:MAG TPA: hypothetical protein VNO22_10180 [Planctomycetota bacterium]|nr:hypothetical protein [Planctomycetota bacterium]
MEPMEYTYGFGPMTGRPVTTGTPPSSSLLPDLARGLGRLAREVRTVAEDGKACVETWARQEPGSSLLAAFLFGALFTLLFRRRR